MMGAGLIASLLDADEMLPRYRLVPLALLSSRWYSDGVVRLYYRVLPAAQD